MMNNMVVSDDKQSYSYVDAFINVIDFSIKKQDNINSDSNEYRFCYDYIYFLNTIGITGGNVYAKWENLEQDIIPSVIEYYAKKNYDCVITPSTYKRGKSIITEKINIIITLLENKSESVENIKDESEVIAMSRQRFTKAEYEYLDDLWEKEYFKTYELAVSAKDGKPRNLKREFKSMILAKFHTKFPERRDMNDDLAYEAMWHHFLHLPKTNKIRRHNKSHNRHNKQSKSEGTVEVTAPTTAIADSGVNNLVGDKDVDLVAPKTTEIKTETVESKPTPIKEVQEVVETIPEPVTTKIIYKSKYKKYRVRVDVVYKLGVLGKHSFTFDDDILAEDANDAWTHIRNLLDRLKGNASYINIKDDTKIIEEIEMLD